MERTAKYFSVDYDNDTMVEYITTGFYSQLNCSYTSEDDDYGTETIRSTARPVKELKQMAYEMLQDLRVYLDGQDVGDMRGVPYRIKLDYDQYGRSTLIAVESALAQITRDYSPNKWYMTIASASKMVADALLKDRTKLFHFCESNSEEAEGDPEKHVDEGGWFGIKRIKGFFDNEPEEFIIAVGHWGGGDMAFEYDYGVPNATEYAESAVRKAMCKASDLDPDDYIYIELEEKGNMDKMDGIVSTKLGNLYARTINDNKYPGIQIGLERDGMCYEFAWVEVDQSGDEKAPIMKVHAYDTESDEPVFDMYIDNERLYKLFRKGE